MKKLRIAVIGNIITQGSADVFLKKFLRILLPLTETVYVFSDWSHNSNDSRIKVVTPVRFVIKRLFTEDLSAKTRITRYLLVQLVTCINLLKAAKCIHVILIFDTLMVGPIFLAKLMRKKVVPFVAAKVQTTLPKEITLGKCQTKIVELAKHVVFSLSDIIIVESTNLIYWLNLNRYKNKLRVRSTFVNTDIFKPVVELKKRADIVGYVGNLIESKGVKQFVKSFPFVMEKRPSVSFLICGDGPCYQEIKQIVTENQCSEKVILTGWIDHSKIPTYLNQLKLLVLPSETEGLPNIILETMACGTPVLATPVGGIPDIIRDGETGFLLKSNDPKHIADRITELLGKPGLLEKVSVNAHRNVGENFSFQKTLEAWQKIFNELH
jgi:glycosyltransferase involved in cell wall biosynthesis